MATSVHVSFGRQPLRRRRQLHVVGAARDDALARLDAALDADQVAVARRDLDEAPRERSPPVCTNTYGRPASISTAAFGTAGTRCVAAV